MFTTMDVSSFQYFESLLPLSPRSYYTVLNRRVDALKSALGENGAYYEYSGILAATLELARGDRRAGETGAERRMRFESARDCFVLLVTTVRKVARLVHENISEINGKEGDPASLEQLHRWRNKTISSPSGRV